MTRFLYNSNDIFSGICPAPLFSRSVETIRVGERWGERQVLTLQGQITGNCADYATIIAKKRSLLSGFASDFYDFEVEEDASIIASFDAVKVDSISFTDSTFASPLVPFSIQLSCYPSGYFSGQWGVLSPINSLSFSESEDGVISINQSVSAQGFATSGGTNNALNNARSWVATQTGWAGQVAPLLITGAENPACLRTISENIDRLNGTYGVQLTYIADRYGDTDGGLLRYSSEFSSGIEDGLMSVAVQGSVQGCRYQSLADLRSRYLEFNAFNEALGRYRQITSKSDLNPYPVSKGVSEDSTYVTLSFEYLYNNDTRPLVSVSYIIQFSYAFEEDIVSANISATIASRSQFESNTWQEVQRIAAGVDLLALVVPAFAEYVAEVAPHLSAFPLNPSPLSTSYSEDKFSLSISRSATYDNRPIPPIGLETLETSVSITPSLDKFAAQPILDAEGEYYIFDLGHSSRAKVSTTANGRVAENSTPSEGLEAIKRRVDALNAEYGAGQKMLLEAQSYSTGNAAYRASLTASSTVSSEQTVFSL